jgi:ribosomal protein L11 methyltransferase
LGAADVVGIDVDPDALANARENVALNGGTGIVMREADLASAPGTLGRTFDVVLANLTAAAIERYADELAGLIAPGGRLIASGFQDEDARPVEAALQSVGLATLDRGEEEGWLAGVWTVPTTPSGPRAR